MKKLDERFVDNSEAIQTLIDTPYPVSDLGALGSTVTLDMDSKAEYHAKGTLGAGDTTFTIANAPADATGVVLDLTTGATVGNLTFTNASPAPTIEASKNYRLIFTKNQIIGNYWLQAAELT